MKQIAEVRFARLSRDGPRNSGGRENAEVENDGGNIVNFAILGF